MSLISIKKKFYKTFSDFPKINHDLSEKNIKLNNNMSIPTTRENYTKSLVGNRNYKNGTNVENIIKQPKKILLMNPDDLPLNYFDKAYKDIIKNNSKGNGSDRTIINKNNEIKENNFFGKKENDNGHNNINIFLLTNERDNSAKNKK